MNHAMIDLETLSTVSDAAIISIGIAIFNDEQTVDSAGWALAPGGQHGSLDPKTIGWWMEQCDAAREFSFNGKITSMTAAFEIKSMLAKHDVHEVWSKDPHFDHIILFNWWERVKLIENLNIGDFPYHYRAPRSYRTLESECIRLGFDEKDWAQYNFVAHNPVDDAMAQARAVMEMRRLIGSRAT